MVKVIDKVNIIEDTTIIVMPKETSITKITDLGYTLKNIQNQNTPLMLTNINLNILKIKKGEVVKIVQTEKIMEGKLADEIKSWLVMEEL